MSVYGLSIQLEHSRQPIFSVMGEHISKLCQISTIDATPNKNQAISIRDTDKWKL